MVKKHLKTLTAPVSWPVKRKSTKFIVRPKPGKPFTNSMPLALVFRNMLKYCKTMKEVKAILQDKEILVDGKRRKDPKYSLGLMDTLSITVSKEHYRVLINKSKKLFLQKISEDESKKKLSKITGKSLLPKGKTQLNFYDGSNIIVKEDKYKVGDSVLLALPGNKIKTHFKSEKGSYVFMIKGGHTGEHGTIEEISGNMMKIKNKEHTFETPKGAAFVLGKGKSEIKLEK